MFGIEPFREQLDEKLDLIQFAVDELRKIEGIEIVAEPQLTITAFRYRDDEQTRELLARINERKRVMLTPTTLPDGRFVIRIAIVSHRTHRDRIEMLLADVKGTTGGLRRPGHGPGPVGLA